jgi:hypothetical protein
MSNRSLLLHLAVCFGGKHVIINFTSTKAYLEQVTPKKADRTDFNVPNLQLGSHQGVQPLFNPIWGCRASWTVSR